MNILKINTLKDFEQRMIDDIKSIQDTLSKTKTDTKEEQYLYESQKKKRLIIESINEEILILENEKGGEDNGKG